MYGLGDDDDQYKYHNAEGVYIGTSPKSTDQPMAANDRSNNIVVRNSTINTFGSECFEVKENAHHNRIENSDCGFNDEPKSFQGSNIELRGDHNTVLRPAEPEPQLEPQAGLGLVDLRPRRQHGPGQQLPGATGAAIVNRQTGSGPFCGNTFTGTVSEGNSIGNPTATCAGVDATAPTVTARTPAANATGIALRDNVIATFSEAVQRVSDATFTLKSRFDGCHRGGELRRRVPDRHAGSDGRPGRKHPVHGHVDRGYNRRQGVPATRWRPRPGSSPPRPRQTRPRRRYRPEPGTQRHRGYRRRQGQRDVLGGRAGGHVGTTPGTFTLKNATSGATVSATVAYDASTQVATVKPKADLAANTQYTATLTGGTNAIRDTANNPLGTVTWTFTTVESARGRHQGADGDLAEPEGQRHERQPVREHHGDLQ